MRTFVASSSTLLRSTKRHRRHACDAAVSSATLSSSGSSFNSVADAASSSSSSLSSLAVTAQRRGFSSGTLDPNRLHQLKKSLAPIARFSGRDADSDEFERRVSLMRMGSYDSVVNKSGVDEAGASALQPVAGGTDEDGGIGFMMGSNMQAAAMVPHTAVVKFVPSLAVLRGDGDAAGAGYPKAVRERITRAGECKLMGAAMDTEGHLVPTFDPTAHYNRHQYRTMFAVSTAKPVESAIIYLLQPSINSHEFRFEEAQVELIAAYRNVLVEVADTKGIDRLVLPPLCLSSCGYNHRYAIAKLNQAAIIKGFHRLAPHDKEELLVRRRDFTVEVYVDDAHYEDFYTTFQENAWDPPTNLLVPPRMDLYPGLAPPVTLLDADGWVGKRPELIEAINTGGTSLLEGTHYALDGSPIVKLDASVYGSLSPVSRAERLAAEAATARKLGYVPKPLAALEGGLEGDAYQPVVHPTEEPIPDNALPPPTSGAALPALEGSGEAAQATDSVDASQAR